MAMEFRESFCPMDVIHLLNSLWSFSTDNCMAELNAFLQTINELTVDLPAESD